ncbi:NUDIX domain-containing protein [bacterium]|jgi:8-oxo-dGTP pyrophosphatase MutT (NUDIX family)|nr:NUDIX domain-containing protein [bacterium]MBT6831583.1 NUDIX domain-containing protein [bacterium]MBT6995962.1 NUDIX domain-containing protein [bacterium]MBT7772263.1 NUDIX domain-containing protein [bacterium]
MEKYRLVAATIVVRDFEDSKKFLLVRKPRVRYAWQFPQGGRENGETFLVTAARELREECGEKLQVKFLTLSEIGEYQYDFPKNFSKFDDDLAGAQVHFFRAVWIGGEVDVDGKEIVAHRWVTKTELHELVEESYWDVVREWI